MHGDADDETYALVLVVEDDCSLRALIVMVLEIELRVRVEVAGDGASGLEKAGRLKPDLILLDINLPRIGGLEVARRLKASQDTESVPIVVVTSESQTEAMSAVSEDYLGKPFDVDELVDVTRRYLYPQTIRSDGHGS